MKRFLIFLFCFCAPLYAGQDLREDTATQVTIKLVDATDGVTPETAYTTVGNAVVTLVKHADSGMASTALTLTASGGSNDSAHLANGVFSLELTATDTSTPGRLDLYVTCGTTCITGGAAPYEAHFIVIPQITYDQKYTADFLSAADVTAAVLEADPSTYSSGQTGYYIYRSKRSIVEGTADSGTTTTIVDAARTEADTDYWKGDLIKFTSGVMSGQVREITGFSASTDTITFAPAVTQDTNTETYEILPGAGYLRPATAGRTLMVSAAGEADANVTHWNDTQVPTEDTPGYPKVTIKDGTGQGELSITAGQLDGLSTAGQVATAVWAETTRTLSAGAITASTIGADAFTAAKFHDDVSTEFAAKLLATPYEGTETFKDFMRFGAAMLFNNFTSSSGTYQFKNLSNTKTRVGYSTTSTSRTTTTRDATD